MLQFVSWEAATKENKWQGRNITRWQSPEADKLYRETEVELDPVKRAASFIKMNDLAVQNHILMGIVQRPTVSAQASKLNCPDQRLGQQHLGPQRLVQGRVGPKTPSPRRAGRAFVFCRSIA